MNMEKKDKKLDPHSNKLKKQQNNKSRISK